MFLVGLTKSALADLTPISDPCSKSGTCWHSQEYQWILYNLFSPAHVIIAAVVLVVVIISVIILFKMRKIK